MKQGTEEREREKKKTRRIDVLAISQAERRQRWWVENRKGSRPPLYILRLYDHQLTICYSSFSLGKQPGQLFVKKKRSSVISRVILGYFHGFVFIHGKILACSRDIKRKTQTTTTHKGGGPWREWEGNMLELGHSVIHKPAEVTVKHIHVSLSLFL